MNKSQLPSKMCPACGRRFNWRRKWARCWDEVVYCSRRCRRERGSGSRRETTGPLPGEADSVANTGASIYGSGQ